MPAVTFVLASGAIQEVPLTEGSSLMEIAKMHAVPGIDGDCGGCCACGTCHVIVDEAWRNRLPPITSAEAQMLAIHAGADPGSRLACQIPATAALDGLRVRVPDHQF
ncbi:ferredoxin, 2Fe-2S [Fontimonas thermophila]|uniref:Ferredoxin, 2Fe-2S n=1 Tax=Fontimonas thermophila TaxID=1076937 RepID=A0A1I2JQJ2_9GAMM|nr:2Fe-2S iron-sulfur cluster-binding protein [Fontimonas thermophila]SFF57062.1 ferredoxin, 2Fe-2S [Fontimonas thermophila]